jgi:hypothetical protein
MMPAGDSEAIAEYREALRLRPDHAEGLRFGNGAVTRSRSIAGGDRGVQIGLAKRTRFFEAHVNLANALAQCRDGIAEAIAEYEAALRLRADPVVRENGGQTSVEAVVTATFVASK